MSVKQEHPEWVVCPDDPVSLDGLDLIDRRQGRDGWSNQRSIWNPGDGLRRSIGAQGSLGAPCAAKLRA